MDETYHFVMPSVDLNGMSLVPLRFKPTVVKDETSYDSETTFVDAQWFRFWRGKPETIGGYQRAFTEVCEGICRGLAHWSDSVGTQHYIVGTHLKLYAFSGGIQSNITPPDEVEGTLTNAIRTLADSKTVTISHVNHGLKDGDVIYLYTSEAVGGALIRGAYTVTVLTSSSYSIEHVLAATSTIINGGTSITYYYPRQTLSNIFTTTAGSTEVVVTHVAHGRNSDDRVFYSDATPVGGIIIDGEYSVLVVLDDDSYTIVVDSAPNTSTTGGGNVSVLYELGVGRESGVGGFGYGTGTYGTGPYGTSEGKISDLPPSTWSLARYGDEGLFCRFGGKLYKWNRQGRAIRLYGAPTQNNVVLVSNERIILVGGTQNADGDFDPMLLRWNNAEVEYDWDLTDNTTTSGDFPLNVGSQIMAMKETDKEILTFTDEALYSVQFNTQSVYTPVFLASECGISGPNAHALLDKRMIWASNRGVFFMYAGGPVDRVDCPIQKFMFDSIPENQGGKIYGGTITEFGEAWFLYETADENKYVIYNPSADSWSTGNLNRTAILDAGSAPRPLMACDGVYLYFHELGTTDDTGAPIEAYIETGSFDLGEGDMIVFIDRIIPDFVLTASEISVTIKGKKYPNTANTTKTYTVTSDTDRINCRLRGRHLTFRVDKTVDGKCRWGNIRLDVQPDGSQ